ncbi:MAG: ParM/StbA family protein [Cellulosilyticum sp.]|nr:ParM/StbA family protein [Cellulosilyticum sp.]
MGKKAYIGIDVGNYDTKSANTTTTSGYKAYPKAPFGAIDVITVNNHTYVPTLERFPYVKDKTTDDRCFILTLYGIAKELVDRCKDKNDDLAVKKEIEAYSDLYLGVGLPPSHMASLSENLKNYYKEKFEGGIEFIYNDIKFKFNLKQVCIYPQDYAAVVTYKPKNPDFVSNKFKDYYAIDIGGYTVDVVPIHVGKPVVDGCVSLDLGVLKMFDEIENVINRDFGYTIDASTIESVLKDEVTICSAEEIAVIKKMAREWCDNIINKLREKGLEFNSKPVIFLGGGSKLFRKFIKENKLIRLCDFITNPRANAVGYEKLLKAECRNL